MLVLLQNKGNMQELLRLILRRMQLPCFLVSTEVPPNLCNHPSVKCNHSKNLLCVLLNHMRSLLRMNLLCLLPILLIKKQLLFLTSLLRKNLPLLLPVQLSMNFPCILPILLANNLLLLSKLSRNIYYYYIDNPIEVLQSPAMLRKILLQLPTLLTKILFILPL
jgi:hypothetical protein